jgi:hypothetical protein
MTKAQALYAFFSSFGVDAYEENSVYSLESPPSFPYITYQCKTDSFGDYDASITFSTWHRSASWAASNALISTISAAIGRGGKIINGVDNGYLLILRGSPFSQAMGDPSDDMVKRQYCNLKVRFYTND